MNNNFFLTGLILAILIIFFSCNEEPSFLGKNILPQDDNVSIQIDSLVSIKGYSVELDHVKVSDKYLSPLGIYEDSIFGISQAGFIGQLEHEQGVYDLELSYTIDTVKLTLRYDDFLGNSEFDGDIEVYELTNDLNRDLDYYSDIDYTTYYNEANNLVDSYSFSEEFITKDSIIYQNGESIDTIEVLTDTTYFVNLYLIENLGQKLLNADSATVSTTDNFVDYFKGLCIKATSGTSSILDINCIGTANTKLTVCFTDTSSHEFYYKITQHSSLINIFENNYTGYPIETAINDTINDYDELYIQAMTGSSGFLKLDLDYWINYAQDSSVAINKAELIIKPDFSAYPNEGIFPETLRIFTLEEGYDMFSPEYFDYLYDDLATSNYQAFYDASSGSYTFNLTLHIQKIIQNDIENNPLIVIAGSNTISTNRVVVKNGSHPDPMKLKIYYTKLSY